MEAHQYAEEGGEAQREQADHVDPQGDEWMRQYPADG